MTIKVYPSIMHGDPSEVYDDYGMTVEQWIQNQARNYKPGNNQPVSCTVNGEIIKPEHWSSVEIRKTDTVEFRVMPQGDATDALGFVFPTVFGPIAGAQAVVESLIDIPDIGGGGRGQQGQRISPADARANTARLGQGVPEGFGYYIRYPDYLNQPRKYYQDETTQALNLMLCVGVGTYQINDDDVRIGQSRINELSTVSYEIFEPGADVSGNEAHENWYASPEVGATTASAGIRLKGFTFDERTYSGSATGTNDTLSGITVQDAWEVGITGAIDLTQAITVVDGGSGVADTFQGDFQHLVAGITVNVVSDVNVNGTYVVTTINGTSTEITLETTGGAPVEDATAGSGAMAIDKSGTQYELTTINSTTSIDVTRQLTGGATDTDWTGSLPQGALTVDVEWD